MEPAKPRWTDPDAYDAFMGRWSEHLAKPFLAFADVAPGGRVLDVACGTGVLTKALAEAGAHVVAVARTVGGLEELDNAIRSAGGSATLVPLDVTDFEGLGRLAGVFARQRATRGDEVGLRLEPGGCHLFPADDRGTSAVREYASA